MRTFLHRAAACLLAPWLAACSATIIPPPDPANPVSVFVLDHGRHSSLVLPATAGGTVRYSYGDWDYYVLERTGLASGLRALAWPSPAALGRKRLPGASDAASIRSQLRIEVIEALEIRVEAEAARRLHDELEALFDQGRPLAMHYSDVYDVHFVHHPQPYTLRRNSNRMVGDWLESLHCEVRGLPLLSNWRVMPR